MKNDSVKWLIAGIAGATFIFFLFIGTGVAVYWYALDHMPAGVFAETVDEEQQARDEKEAKEEAEHQAEIEALSKFLELDKIYTPVYLYESAHGLLYREKKFAEVEKRLSTARDTAKTPFERYRYTLIIEDISELYDEEDPEEHLVVADAWVAASPDSYLPLLVRGKLNMTCAWHYRGSGYVSEVSRSGWKKFEQYSKAAWKDLTAAQKLNPSDAEIPAALVEAAAGVGKDLKTIRAFYDATLALNPHHVRVRYAMFNYLRPVWYGSWKEMDAFIAEQDAAIAEFPFLYEFVRDTSTYFEDRGKKYEGLWDSPETMRKAAAAFKAQAELTPDELTVLGSAAYFATQVGDLATAVDFFERIGNRFPVTDEFPSTYGYHWWRVYALSEYSIDPSVIGTPREKELLDMARAAEPSGLNTNGLYMAFLARTKDDALTKAFFDGLTDEYYMTGEIGSPPDYDQMKAMALAERSDERDFIGTDRELPLIEEAMALYPDNALVRLVYAEYFISRKDYEQARVHLEKARELDPKYLPALLSMGWLNYHQKRWDDGIAAAKEFLGTESSQWVARRAKEAEEIIELCEKKKAKEAAG